MLLLQEGKGCGCTNNDRNHGNFTLFRRLVERTTVTRDPVTTVGAPVVQQQRSTFPVLDHQLVLSDCPSSHLCTIVQEQTEESLMEDKEQTVATPQR